MPTAEIIAIGTELLLGEIQDTNTRYLARRLRDIGVDLYRATIIGDNVHRIAQTVKEALSRSDIIITTGGLGPTVDDPTREAVAAALDVQTEYHPELWEQILERYKKYSKKPTENNRRQAYIPKIATGIENPVGTAPAFRVNIEEKVIISLPGVPREMEYLSENMIFPYLQEAFSLYGKIIKAKVLHTAGAGESQIDDLIGDLEKKSNPTVGLLAHPGQTDIRITAKAETEEIANKMIEEMASTIYQRVGKFIFGCDGETLETVLQKLLKEKDWKLVAVEAGLKNELTSKLNVLEENIGQFLSLPDSCGATALKKKLQELLRAENAEVGLGVDLKFNSEDIFLSMIIITPDSERERTRTFGGAPALASSWGANHALNAVRVAIVESKSER